MIFLKKLWNENDKNDKIQFYSEYIQFADIIWLLNNLTQYIFYQVEK